MTAPNYVLIQAALGAAVPLWIEQLKQRSLAHVHERTRVCGQVVAEKGDVIQFRGKQGETANAFNRLAEGLACLAFAPGGVTAFGLHFEAKHPEDVR